MVSADSRHREHVAAMAIPGSKRRAVLAIVADYLDSGRRDPSIREISAKSPVNRMSTAALIERLAADGLLEITARGDGRSSRSRYAIPGVSPAPNIETTEEEKSMSTKAPPSYEPVISRDPMIRFRAFSDRWLPELQAVDWPRYRQRRDEHLAAVAAYEATEPGSIAELDALLALTDVAESVSLDLRENEREAQAALNEAVAVVAPPDSGPLAATPRTLDQVARAGIQPPQEGRLGPREAREMALLLREDGHTLRAAVGNGLNLLVEPQLHELRVFARRQKAERGGA